MKDNLIHSYSRGRKPRGENRSSGYLAEAEAGMAVRDVRRKHNVSEQSFYCWKAKYGGMEVSEVKRLKELERENYGV